MPAPPRGSLPNDVVIMLQSDLKVEGSDSFSTTHWLAKNGRAVVFHSKLKMLASLAYLTEDDTHLLMNQRYERRRRAVRHALSIIHSFLPSIDFENYNCIYINQTDKGFNVTARRKIFHHRIDCPLWSNSIYEHEIEVTRWNADSQANGFWKGKPVDITFAYDETTTRFLNGWMKALYAIRDLDLTFEVYGHLLDRSGNVIGLVTEAAWGRCVQEGDRSAVYATFAKLQRRYCLGNGLHLGLIFIAGGKVRIDHSTLNYFPPEKRNDFERRADILHWERLDQLFTDIKDGNPPPQHWQFWPSVPLLLPVASLNPSKHLQTRIISLVGFHTPHKHGEPVEEADPSKNPFNLAERMKHMEEVMGPQITILNIDFSEGAGRWFVQLSSASQKRRRERRQLAANTTRRVIVGPYRRNAPKVQLRLPSVESDRTQSDSGHSRFEEIS